MGFGEAVADPRVSATAASAAFAAPGRITQMVGQDGTSSYGYDSESQLTSATHSYQSNEAYSFDNNGNRTMSGYQTGSDNRLTNDGTYSYTYDAEGNRTRRTKTATGEVTEYEWDYHNRLVKVTDKNSQGTVTQVVEYIYDIFNRRIGRKLDTTAPFDMANAVIERYVLDDIHNGLSSADGGNVVQDFVDSDGSRAQPIAMSKRYLYGEAVDQIFAQEDLSKTLGDAARNFWPLVDHLGTVRDLAKQDGTIAVHYKYDSFGNVTSGDTSKTRYLFTSREFDTATKLQYNRARYYDAAVGRWISEDPLGFAAGDANAHRVVRNGVAQAIDPSGLFEDDKWPDDPALRFVVWKSIIKWADDVSRLPPHWKVDIPGLDIDLYFPIVPERAPADQVSPAIRPPFENPTEPPRDFIVPGGRPPSLGDVIKDYVPDIVQWIAKEGLKLDETDAYQGVVGLIDDMKEWGKEHPVGAVIVGGAIGVGIGVAVPPLVEKLNPLLDAVGLPPNPKISFPSLHIPVGSFIPDTGWGIPGFGLELGGYWQPGRSDSEEDIIELRVKGGFTW